MPIPLLVLNYNGRELLAECLPSVVAAAARASRPCVVAVVDNGSTDGSRDWLLAHYPEVRVFECQNEGLCSYNRVLAELAEPVAVLLNNDIKLAADSVDPLLEPLLGDGADPSCFLTAPLCYLFDGATYEGQRTSVRWRGGLVEATSHFPGNAGGRHQVGPTANAGAALAVHRQRFLDLSGFDPVFSPGRIEDLDLCYRAYLAGWTAWHVPQAVAYHRGQATFGRFHGQDGSLQLAWRNTLLFQWKNFRHPAHIVRQAVAILSRIAWDVIRLPWSRAGTRLAFCRALGAALGRYGSWQPTGRRNLARERQWFTEFSPAHLADPAAGASRQEEARRAAGYPVSRWYLRPLAGRIAQALRHTAARPWHITLLGLALALAAALTMALTPQFGLLAALLILATWTCDRTDGQLARLTGRGTPQGAWLDANIDEGVDLLWQGAVAVAASQRGAAYAGAWLSAFLVGKYLFMYGLAQEEAAAPNAIQEAPRRGWLRAAGALYHLPGNADIRVHLLAVAVATGWYLEQLIAVAVYYNLRWLVRYALVIPRLSAAARQGATG